MDRGAEKSVVLELLAVYCVVIQFTDVFEVTWFDSLICIRKIMWLNSLRYVAKWLDSLNEHEKKEILKHGSGNVIKITSSLDDVRCRCLELGYENGLELPKFLVFIVIFVVFIEWIRQQKKTYLTFYRHPFLVRHSTIHRKSYSLFFRFLMYEIFELIEFIGSNARSISYRKKNQSTSAGTGGMKLIQRLFLRYSWRQHATFWRCFYLINHDRCLQIMNPWKAPVKSAAEGRIVFCFAWGEQRCCRVAVRDEVIQGTREDLKRARRNLDEAIRLSTLLQR